MRKTLMNTPGVLLRVNLNILNPTLSTINALEKTLVYSSISDTLLSHYVIRQDTRGLSVVSYEISDTLDSLKILKEEVPLPLPLR
jgi:hypothetical protein